MPRWLMFLLLPIAACASDPAPEAGATARAAAQAAAPAPPPAEAAPAFSLVGATSEALRAALGEPLLRRSEGPAQIWLYAGGGCQLDIVLYPGETGPRVAHVQARAGGITQRSAAACLRDIAGQASHPLPRRPDATTPFPPASGNGFDV